jgi:hypothetical protein
MKMGCSSRGLASFAASWIAIFAFQILFVHPAAVGQDSPPTLVSLCRVFENPQLYNGQLLRFHARASTDGIEHTTLFDPKCNKGVSPWTTDESDRRPDVEAFNRAIEAQKPGRPEDVISADFIGRFEYEPQRGLTRSRLFEIREVKNLVVAKGTGKSIKGSGGANPPRLTDATREVVSPAESQAEPTGQPNGATLNHESGHVVDPPKQQ